MMSENPKMTLGLFRRLTADLPDSVVMTYHCYYKGMGLNAYRVSDHWLYPKGETTTHIVLNPSDDYDGRAARKIDS